MYFFLHHCVLNPFTQAFLELANSAGLGAANGNTLSSKRLSNVLNTASDDGSERRRLDDQHAFPAGFGSWFLKSESVVLVSCVLTQQNSEKPS